MKEMENFMRGRTLPLIGGVTRVTLCTPIGERFPRLASVWMDVCLALSPPAEYEMQNMSSNN